MREDRVSDPVITSSDDVNTTSPTTDIVDVDVDVDVGVGAAIEDAGSASTGSQRLRLISTYTRRPGGLKSDRIRQLAWPILLGASEVRVTFLGTEKRVDSSLIPASGNTNWRDLPEHKDEGQVRLDVDRSFIYYPKTTSESQLDRLKVDLLEVITATLRQHPQLCYFQGFHDIAQVLLLVLGKERAVIAVPRLSLLRLRDFMLPSLSSSLTHLELLPAILAAADSVLARHIAGTKPFFALAATLTLFAHDIESYSEIGRLFDFLLAEEAAVAIYLFAAIILARRDELLAIPVEDEDILSFTLSKLPKPLDFEPIIKQCITLIETLPPEKLPRRAWAKVSPYSVLKTTHGRMLHSVSDAERFFDAQLAQLVWQQRRQKVLVALWTYRRPVSGIGAAVLVAILSYWLQRGSGQSALSALVGKIPVLGKKAIQLVHGG